MMKKIQFCKTVLFILGLGLFCANTANAQEGISSNKQCH